MKYLILLLKKSELLSGLSIRLVYLTRKAKVPIHPKHLVRQKHEVWYKKLLNKKMIVLDVGCGSGQHSLQIAKKVKKVIGLDKDQKGLNIATQDATNKRIKNAIFLKANLENKINLKDSSIDLVILFDVLEHIKNRQKFLAEIKRVLKENAPALVVIPNNNSKWKIIQRKYGISSFSDPDHKIEYTKKSISNELERAGFTIKEITAVSYDTPFVGFIDLIGGISLSLYEKILKWKKTMVIKYPEDCSGFQIIAIK